MVEFWLLGCGEILAGECGGILTGKVWWCIGLKGGVGYWLIRCGGVLA